MRDATRWSQSRSFFDVDNRTSAARFINGSGRSGTTWLQELACRAGGLRPVFEPFDVHHDGYFNVLRPGRYIRPVEMDACLREPATRVLTGKYRSPWSDQLSRPRRYRGRVIKDIRSSLWVGWLSRSFPEVPVAHVIRHPLLVARSAHALGWDVDYFDLLLAQPDLLEDHLGPYVPAIKKLNSPWTRLIAGWCVENLVVFRTLGGASAQLIIYDSAVRDGKLLESMLRHFGIAVEELGNTSIPSSMSRRNTRKSASSLPPVQAELLREGMRILEAFGFDAFFSPSGGVDVHALEEAWNTGGARHW